jgi:hypothetical protein
MPLIAPAMAAVGYVPDRTANLPGGGWRRRRDYGASPATRDWRCDRRRRRRAAAFVRKVKEAEGAPAGVRGRSAKWRAGRALPPAASRPAHPSTAAEPSPTSCFIQGFSVAVRGHEARVETAYAAVSTFTIRSVEIARLVPSAPRSPQPWRCRAGRRDQRSCSSTPTVGTPRAVRPSASACLAPSLVLDFGVGDHRQPARCWSAPNELVLAMRRIVASWPSRADHLCGTARPHGGTAPDRSIAWRTAGRRPRHRPGEAEPEKGCIVDSS